MLSCSDLTHWGRDQIDAISQTIFSNAFSWMKVFKFRLRFHWSLFLRVQLTIFQHWFIQWLGAVQATSHYLNQWWLIYRRIYASFGLNELRQLNRDIRPQWVKTTESRWDVTLGSWNALVMFFPLWLFYTYDLMYQILNYYPYHKIASVRVDALNNECFRSAVWEIDSIPSLSIEPSCLVWLH